MTQNPKTFENLPDEKRERVLNEATSEFAEHGYHQASINRIVKRLGIAKGSLFKYFGNKQGLFEYLFGHAINQFKQPLKHIRETTSDKDFFERIEKSLLAGVDFIQAHPHIYRIYLKMLFQENFPMRDKFLSEVRRGSTKYLRPLVTAAMKSGELRNDLDPDMVVFHLDSIMDRFFQAHTVPYLDGPITLYDTDKQTTENKARAITDFLRRGLGNPS
ncbi:TetR family transcriptional regulator [Pseudodesulfovibrio nedwellii]|uniref:TetR family transcriptional regulator n=1 Tax=Pseudodesulfovibrio nedwellii TaxID=2973072 RepID=A0ABN6S727_9BACT|nr:MULTISPECIES: TetR/AcrR family transcriptional regulator [Pseudodesulfovibrio]BDQ39071.1 TetR family transcriptional regulator [Pseudodesulfovibrio nedwellii]